MSLQKVKVKGQGHRGQDQTLSFPDCNSSLNSYIVIKWCTQLDDTKRGALLFLKVIRQVQGHTAIKSLILSQGKKARILSRIGRFRTVTQV